MLALGPVRRERCRASAPAEHVQRGDAEDLRPPRSNRAERARAGRPRPRRPRVRLSGEPAPVDADLVTQDALAHQLLGEARGRPADLRGSGPSRNRDCSASVALTSFLDRVQAGLALTACRRWSGRRPARPRSRCRRLEHLASSEEHRELAVGLAATWPLGLGRGTARRLTAWTPPVLGNDLLGRPGRPALDQPRRSARWPRPRPS